MASASRPVGVRLWETCNADGAMPAPVRASATCAVAGFGDPAASRPKAFVTVFLTASVAAAAGPAVDCPGDGFASGPAVAVSVVNGFVPVPMAVEAAVAGPVAPGWTTDGTPPTHPDKAAAKAPPAIAATRRRAALPEAEGAADAAPADWFCRWSGVVRMGVILPCGPAAASQPGRAGRGRGVPLSCPPRKPRGTLILGILDSGFGELPRFQVQSDQVAVAVFDVGCGWIAIARQVFVVVLGLVERSIGTDTGVFGEAGLLLHERQKWFSGGPGEVGSAPCEVMPHGIGIDGV